MSALVLTIILLTPLGVWSCPAITCRPVAVLAVDTAAYFKGGYEPYVLLVVNHQPFGSLPCVAATEMRDQEVWWCGL